MTGRPARPPVRSALTRLVAAGILVPGALMPVAAGAVDGEGKKQVFVKTLQGKTITLDVNDGASIGGVKEKIRDIEGIPVDQQRILYNGRELSDSTEVSAAVTPSSVVSGHRNAQAMPLAGLVDLPGSRMILQTVAEGKSPMHVRGAFAVGRRRTAALGAVAAAGGLVVPRGAAVTARVTSNACRARLAGVTIRPSRAGACRVVVSVSRRNESVRRTPVLVIAE